MGVNCLIRNVESDPSLTPRNKIINRPMSVVVASHFVHNIGTGKKQVRFLSNSKVQLPPIEFSKIQKQLFGEVHIPQQHKAVAQKQLYREVWHLASKLQASASKELNARFREREIEVKLDRKKEVKTQQMQNRSKRLEERMISLKRDFMSKQKQFQERRQRIYDSNKKAEATKLRQFTTMIRSRILSTADHSPSKTMSPNKLIISQRKTIGEIPTHSSNKNAPIRNLTPTKRMTQHRRTTSDAIQHVSVQATPPKPTVRISSTQSTRSIQEKISQAWDSHYNDILAKAITKQQTITKARKIKELTREKTLKEAEFHKQELDRLHKENIRKNEQRLEERLKRTLEKTSRCRTTDSSRSERTLSAHPQLTPTLSLRRLSCRPTYTKPIREKLHAVSLEFYKAVRNREDELILKKP